MTPEKFFGNTVLNLDFNEEPLKRLTPDSYKLEVEVLLENGDVAKSPTNGGMQFYINKNLKVMSDPIVPVVTFDTVLEAVDKKIDNYLATVVKGDRGDKGDIGASALPVAGVYPTLADLTTANPNNAYVYITTDNGNWNYWNGTNWVAGGIYQATAIGDDAIVSKNISYITPRDIRDTYANEKNISGWNLPASFTSLNHTIMFTGSAGNSGILIPVDLPDGVTYAFSLRFPLSQF